MENFLAAGESRINLWNLERPGENPVYNLIDYNRQKSIEGDEIVTSAKFMVTKVISNTDLDHKMSLNIIYALSIDC